MGAFLVALLLIAGSAFGMEDEAGEVPLGGLKGSAVREKHRAQFIASPPIMRKGFDLAKHPNVMLHRRVFAKPRHRMPIVRPDPAIDYKILVSRPDPSVEYKLHRIPTSDEATPWAQSMVPVDVPADSSMEGKLRGIPMSPEIARWAQQYMRQMPLNVQDLDVGRYQAIIVQDPNDRRNVRGFLRAFSLSYAGQDLGQHLFSAGIKSLTRYIRDHTQINAQIGGTIGLQDDRLFNVPFICLYGAPETRIAFSEAERRNLGQYLEGGGFLFAEPLGQYDPSTDMPFEQSVKDAVRSALEDRVEFGSLPEDHPLYHTFYDLEEESLRICLERGTIHDASVAEAYGFEIHERTALILSRLNLIQRWEQDDEEALRLGVNLIVFSLAQSGSLANVTHYSP